MVSPKVSRQVPRAAAPRHRSHSLAPEHLGEAGGAAMLVLAIGGLAIFIAAVAITIGGLTLASRYSGTVAPPNIGEVATLQVVGGIALLAFGATVAASAAALLAGLARSRALATIVASVAAFLAAGGVVVLMTATRKDPMLIGALLVTLVAFGGAAIVLARLRR